MIKIYLFQIGLIERSKETPLKKASSASGQWNLSEMSPKSAAAPANCDVYDEKNSWSSW